MSAKTRKKFDSPPPGGYPQGVVPPLIFKYKPMKINDLDSVCIIGLGLLGGSLGLSLNSALPHLRRIGYSHRETTRAKAMEAGAVDEIAGEIPAAVAHADLVILASPIGTFEALL